MATSPSAASPVPLNLPQAYLRQLEDYAYPPDPPRGFEIRLYVLMILAGIALIGAIVHMTVIVLDIRRRGGRQTKAWWIARWANLPSGRYLVTNTKLISAGFSLINLPIIIADLHNILVTSFRHRPQLLTSCFRSLPNVPLLLHITLLTYGQLQAYTLSGQTARLRRRNGEPWRLLSDNTLNFTLFALLAIALFGLLIPFVFVSILGAKTWHTYEALCALLSGLAANWIGSVAPAAVLQLTDLKAQLDAQDQQRTAAFTAAFVCGVAMCFWLMVVNAFALTLPLFIRRSTPPAETPTEDPQYFTIAPSIRRPSTSHSFATSMEKSDLAMLAAREQSRREEKLALANRELMMGCCWLLIVSAFCCGLALSILINVVIPDSFSEITWWGREVTLTLIHWLYSTLHLTLFPILLHRAWLDFHSHSQHGFGGAQPHRGEWFWTKSRRSGAGGVSLVRVKVVVEETEDLKLDPDTRFGRLATVIEGGRREMEEDLEMGEVPSARGGGLEGTVEWQKPDWATTNLAVPERPQFHRSTTSSTTSTSGGWRGSACAPELPRITTTQDAAIPWMWAAGPQALKSKR